MIKGPLQAGVGCGAAVSQARLLLRRRGRRAARRAARVRAAQTWPCRPAKGSRPGAAGDLEPRQLGRGAATRQGRPTHRQAGRLVRPGCPAGGPTAPSSRTCEPPRPGRSASPTSDYDLSNHRPLWAEFKTPTLSTPGRRGAAQHRQAGVACAAGQGYHPRPAGGLTSPTPGAPSPARLQWRVPHWESP